MSAKSERKNKAELNDTRQENPEKKSNNGQKTQDTHLTCLQKNPVTEAQPVDCWLSTAMHKNDGG